MAGEGMRPQLGLALGGGAARGWAHIGVLSALQERGIEPDIICGTSIGALVGGIHAAGKLAELESWVCELTRRDVLALADFTVRGGGMLAGRRLMALYREHLGDLTIEKLPKTFAAVATDLHSGAEVWLQRGPLLSAIRASISIPGIFTPVRRDGRWLVDGALVNPVPVSVCRALGADIVIAVDLHTSPATGGTRSQEPGPQPAVVRGPQGWSLGRVFGRDQPEPPTRIEPRPAFGWTVITSLDIMQYRISRSRLAGDPPDLVLTPRVGRVAPLEFAGGRATVEEGYEEVQRMAPALAYLLGEANQPE